MRNARVVDFWGMMMFGPYTVAILPLQEGLSPDFALSQVLPRLLISICASFVLPSNISDKILMLVTFLLPRWAIGAYLPRVTFAQYFQDSLHISLLKEPVKFHYLRIPKITMSIKSISRVCDESRRDTFYIYLNAEHPISWKNFCVLC